MKQRILIYQLSVFDFSDKNEKLINNIKEIRKQIYKKTGLSENDCKKYAPIFFSIKELLEFMKDRLYISAKDYEMYEKIYKSITDKEIAITVTQPEVATDITLGFAIVIYELYQKHKELFSEHNKDNTQTPFIQNSRKIKGDVICFEDIREAISFIEKHSDDINGSRSFLEYIHKTENAEELIFTGLKKKEALLIDKNRNGKHRVKGSESKEYIAIKVNYLEGLSGM
ncbi:MAG: hypothetical protein J1F64_03065 [Oscillospiraceae bacterium]|nr:hypothetical protein [Oscillospiraceae bacterium]